MSCRQRFTSACEQSSWSAVAPRCWGDFFCNRNGFTKFLSPMLTTYPCRDSASLPISGAPQGRLTRLRGVRLLGGLLVALHWVNAAPAPSVSHFRNDAATGPHAAGFRVVAQYDYSRTFQPQIDELGRPYSGERARPIQTSIWYPAEKSSQPTMTWGDYVALDATQVSFDRPRAIPPAAG